MFLKRIGEPYVVVHHNYWLHVDKDFQFDFRLVCKSCAEFMRRVNNDERSGLTSGERVSKFLTTLDSFSC